ncbi:MAG: hypothetical protein GY809_21735, partial [Planctomycetes bacterium]|nr:hypothetical protein [Planctomycetota bacterium]
MWISRIVLTLLVCATIAASSSTATPAIVGDPLHPSGITGLDIGGIVYDVTFVSSTFDNLWDLSSTYPAFWGNDGGATAATNAINAVLNNTNPVITTLSTGADYFHIPYSPDVSGVPDEWLAWKQGVNDDGGVGLWRYNYVYRARDVEFTFAVFSLASQNGTLVGDPEHPSGITGLKVGTEIYDVTFVSSTFDNLWDLSSTYPAFWGNDGGATAATNAINTVLNGTNPVITTLSTGADYFHIPYSPAVSGVPDEWLAWKQGVHDDGGVGLWRYNYVYRARDVEFTFAVFSSSPSPVVLEDDFNDNTRGEQWTLIEDSPSDCWLDEVNQRLELRSTVASSSSCVYAANGWKISTASDFSLRVDFHFASVTTEETFLFMSFSYDTWDENIIDFTVGSNSNSPFFRHWVSNSGAVYQSGSTVRSVDDGTLYVSYNRSVDELYLSTTGYGSENAWKTVSGLLSSEWNNEALGVTIGGLSSGHAFSSGDVFLDNFVIESGQIHTIIDDNDLPIVTITATDAAAAEPSDNGSFTVNRTGSTSSTLRVYYSTSGSTATSGSDYIALADYVDIPSGQSSALIEVAVIDDTDSEDSQTVDISLSSSTAYTIGSPGSAVVTISDNDGQGSFPGSGTAEDPYRLSTGEQINSIGINPELLGKHFALQQDVDLSAYTEGSFNVIGQFISNGHQDNEPFNGVFDGNGYTITGFTLSTSDVDYIGLFACL